MAEDKTWKYMVYQCQTMKPMLKSKTRCCKFSKKLTQLLAKMLLMLYTDSEENLKLIKTKIVKVLLSDS